MMSFINDAFGLDFQIDKVEKIKAMPIYMTARRTFYKVYNSEMSFILISVNENETFGVVALSKQQTEFEAKCGMPVCFYFDSLKRSQRDSLINHHVPFISADNQLYLPFLGIAIHNNFKKKQEIKIDKMMPLTQSLFLYILYECKGEKIAKKDAADALKVTRTSITRASEQLVRMGLINQENAGKECYMWAELNGMELFRKAEQYLINPVQDEFITEDNLNMKDLSLAGESALAKVTMLNPPKIKCLAIDKDLCKNKTFDKLDAKWETKKKLNRLQLWKYNPSLFEKNGVVDPISLYMTLKDSEDERIIGSLEEMMEDFKW